MPKLNVTKVANNLKGKTFKEIGIQKGTKNLERDTKNLVTGKLIKEFVKQNPKDCGVKYKEELLEFNDYLLDRVLDLREGVELPGYCGILVVIAYPSKFNHINIVKTVKEGTKITYANNESDGYHCRLCFITHDCSKHFKKVKYWGFQATKELNEKLSQTFKKQWKKYAVVSNLMYTRSLYAEKRKKRTKAIAILKSNYNPLEW